MAYIVLTEEQAGVLAEATGAVDVLDPRGQLVNVLQPLAPALVETLRECKQRLASPGPRVPGEQVRSHFERLEEIRQREGMDLEKALDLLRRMRSGESV